MDMIEITCPKCSAKLSVNPDDRHVVCRHCGTALELSKNDQYENDTAPVPDQSDDRKAVHDEFQEEEEPGKPEKPSAPSNEKIWLVILGWLLIFPLPLTILMIKNKKLHTALRIIIIIAGWAAYAALLFASRFLR